MRANLALDEAVWAAPMLILAGTIVTAGVGFLTTVIVKRMGRRGDDATARRAEVEADALLEKATDDDRDRDIEQMRKTVDFAWGTLDRLTAQVASYEAQIVREREEREAQFARHLATSTARMDELQALSDRRHAFVMDEVDALRGELAGTRERIKQHRPWDERVARAVREIDKDFPDPPEL